jgi:AAA family ATP:ADP antiporter
VAAAASPAGLALLQGVVMGGALLYVFSKGAKFSLFKP